MLKSNKRPPIIIIIYTPYLPCNYKTKDNNSKQLCPCTTAHSHEKYGKYHSEEKKKFTATSSSNISQNQIIFY